MNDRMLNLIPPSECDTARAAVSCRLDGELSELGGRRLDDHLRGCPACRVHAAELDALARRLRAAPLEEPAPILLAPRRRRLVRLHTAVAAAAAVGVVAASFAAGGMIGIQGVNTPTAVGTTSVADFLGVQADSNQQHLLAMAPLVARTSLRAGSVVAV